MTNYSADSSSANLQPAAPFKSQKQAQGKVEQVAPSSSSSPKDSCVDLFGNVQQSASPQQVSADSSQQAVRAKTTHNAKEGRDSSAASSLSSSRSSSVKERATCSNRSHCSKDRAISSDSESSDSQALDSFWGEDPSSLKKKKKDKATAQENQALPDDAYTVVQVAINRALYTTFDYKVRGKYRSEILGSRIKVSFGRRGNSKEIGIISGLGANSNLPMKRIKEGELLDQVSLIQRDVFETLCFASDYYHYPLGQTLVLGLPKLLRDGEEASYKKIMGLRLKLDSIIVAELPPVIAALSECAEEDIRARAKAGAEDSKLAVEPDSMQAEAMEPTTIVEAKITAQTSVAARDEATDGDIASNQAEKLAVADAPDDPDVSDEPEKQDDVRAQGEAAESAGMVGTTTTTATAGTEVTAGAGAVNTAEVEVTETACSAVTVETVEPVTAVPDAEAQKVDLGAEVVAAGAAETLYKEKNAQERENELLARKLQLASMRLRSNRQRELLMLLSSSPKRSRELREQGFSALQENALIRAGVAERIDFAQEIQPFDLLAAAAKGPVSVAASAVSADSPTPAIDGILHSAPLPLNAEQQHCLDVIKSYQGYGVFLIHGVTGSGKTEVYLQVIEDCLRHGKQVLILVPEIALTPQTFKRFYERFQVPIATMHSTLSSRERLDAFLDIQKRRAVILIGTRSALFTSIPDLGLIVIDEEHDSSFKQTDNLRYHTRTLAIHRARLCQCKVLLGSATPSLESVFHAQMGHYLRLDLLHRAKSVTMPKLQLVDLKQEEFSDNVKAGVGTIVEEAIGEATAQHHQALLFLNRRGFSHSMVCHSCGHLIMCPHCDTPLTVHYFTHQLQCHICNSAFPIPTVCPFCGATDGLVETGLGTEQVESYLQSRFMDVGIARIDRDIITSKQELETALRHVRSHMSEILIGTQMLAKGHDFPDLTVVGILDVDAGLYTEDFHGLEYTAQLVTQVAGRAGRDNREGQVFIQTRFPQHPLLLRLIEPNFNYYDLALELLRVRREQNLPPYTYQAFVMTNSLERDFAFETLKRLMDDLQRRKELIANVSIAPIESDRIERRFNRYHFHVLLTSAHKAELHKVLNELVHIFDSYKNMRDLRFAIDVDPLYTN